MSNKCQDCGKATDAIKVVCREGCEGKKTCACGEHPCPPPEGCSVPYGHGFESCRVEVEGRPAWWGNREAWQAPRRGLYEEMGRRTARIAELERKLEAAEREAEGWRVGCQAASTERDEWRAVATAQARVLGRQG